MDNVCRTEVGELCVTWRLLQHHLIAIVAVENTSDDSSIVSFNSGTYPDLAQARELLPELTKLWDAVRREFWRKLIPPQSLVAERRALA